MSVSVLDRRREERTSDPAVIIWYAKGGGEPFARMQYSNSQKYENFQSTAVERRGQYFGG
jgi:hypothetical protein